MERLRSNIVACFLSFFFPLSVVCLLKQSLLKHWILSMRPRTALNAWSSSLHFWSAEIIDMTCKHWLFLKPSSADEHRAPIHTAHWTFTICMGWRTPHTRPLLHWIIMIFLWVGTTTPPFYLIILIGFWDRFFFFYVALAVLELAL